jgi:hypothetical protein
VYCTIASVTQTRDLETNYATFNRTITQKALAKHLLSLRILLSTAKLSWIRQFLDTRGFRALENVLDKTAIKKRGGKANDLDETLQSECVQCLRVLMNTEV